mgnify:CR=1 FL=1
MDFLIDFSRKWPTSRDEQVSLKDMMDFIDLWVEVNFNEYDDENPDDKEDALQKLREEVHGKENI